MYVFLSVVLSVGFSVGSETYVMDIRLQIEPVLYFNNLFVYVMELMIACGIIVRSCPAIRPYNFLYLHSMN